MKLKLIIFALLAGLLGYATYWFVISENAGVYLEKAEADLKARGITFSYAAYEVSGFPYRLVLTFEKPVIRFENGALRFQLEAERMEAIAQPWNLSHAIFFPENARGEIAFADNSTTFKPKTLGFSLHTLAGDGYRLSSEAHGVQIPSSPEAGLPVMLKDFSFHLRKETTEDQNTGGLFEPKLLEMVFQGKTGEDLSFQIAVSFRGQAVPEITRPGLEAWRDLGGTLEVEWQTITPGGNTFEGSGVLTLDNSLRPLGLLSLEGAGWEDILTFLQTLGWMDENEAALVGNFFETLHPSEGAEPLPLAITIQDGFLSLGPVRLKEVDPIIPE